MAIGTNIGGPMLIVLPLALVASACTAAPATNATAVPEKSMTATLTADCAIVSAKITLVEESLLTRAQLTPEAAEAKGPVSELKAGDPRVKSLQALLDKTTLAPSEATSVDPRLVIRLACDNGRERIITGSASHDGTMVVEIDGARYAAPASLRRELETLLR